MAPTLYMLAASPCVRAVLILAEAIGLELDQYNLDLINGEHLTEKYLKINPLHTVPTLDDNGSILYDSHVINVYIHEKYGKNDSLYPKDNYMRALIHQGLAFDTGSLFPVLKEIDGAYYKKEITSLTPKMIENIKTLYGFLETLLKRNGWVAIDRISLADINCYSTITSLDYHLPINRESYPYISNWIKRCAELPMFKDDFKYLEKFHDLMKLIGAKQTSE